MLTCVFSSLSFADYREKPPTEKFTKFSTSTLQFYINRKKSPEKPRISLTHNAIILYSDIN